MERRKRCYATGILILASGLCGGLAACSPAGLAVGAGASMATAATEERGLSGYADDAAIQLAINQLWLDHDSDLFLAADITVREGRVLLTGEVPRPEHRVEAARLAWRAEGVRAVINELRVDDTATLVDAAADAAIAQKLKARLLLDEKVRSINYSVDVVNGTVYLLGVAQSRDTLDRAIAYARDMRGVREVVAHVRIKDQPTADADRARPLL
ncbi:BON domain-containing protein [Roseospira visakhapatnamensis]|uniref:Osmotically-inducible protein OsmY n=1 Tax=Roseospira visakhapatnamensis TaxID=390880 RepID=A0A7W6W848_9PROT|nr:BON domain-containing protein [Roseospira visakhapatnamensis]MBB4264469.1 osmotically-inducible protein OsmY [Roseospira visakhapatnamensis]